MQRTAVKANTGWISPGAASRPHKPVNTTKLITRGLVSAKKSRHSAGKAGLALAVIICPVILSQKGVHRCRRTPPLNWSGPIGGPKSGFRRRRSDRVVMRVVVLDHGER